MKKFVISIALGAILCACSDNNSYKINGNISSDFNGETIYLQLPDSAFNYYIADSANVINGKYSFSGKTQSIPQVATLSLKNNGSIIRPFYVILENGNIDVELNDGEIVVSGGIDNELIKNLNNELKPFDSELHNIATKYKSLRKDGELTPELDKSLLERYDSIEIIRSNMVKNFVANNNMNVAGAVVMADNLYDFNEEEIDAIISTSQQPFLKSSVYRKIIKQYKLLQRTSIGTKYSNLTMSDINGNEISLSDYVGKGKYVLVDFWATWCGPCRRDMPNVKKAYDKYKKKGFEIVGISFDSDMNAWKTGSESLGITWPQMSDLKGWKSEGAEVYGIRSIPSTILFDPEGKIVEKNLKGENLDKILQGYLK